MVSLGMLVTCEICFIHSVSHLVVLTFRQDMGFHTQDPAGQDVDDEIDIGGNDQETYGEVQFTEKDILAGDEDDTLGILYLDMVNVDEAGSAQMSLRDLIAEGKVIQQQAPPGATREKVGDVVEVRVVEKVDRAICSCHRLRYWYICLCPNVASDSVTSRKVDQLKSSLCNDCSGYTENILSQYVYSPLDAGSSNRAHFLRSYRIRHLGLLYSQ
jgi:hypothetical protein